MRKTFTTEEDQQLLQLVSAGKQIREIAEFLERPYISVYQRYRVLQRKGETVESISLKIIRENNLPIKEETIKAANRITEPQPVGEYQQQNTQEEKKE